MPDDALPRLLAEAERAYVIAAAGCGKTEAIARAVRLCATRQLVLTHTHAGVAALRRRLVHLGVSHSKYRLDTIAGWALRYAASYPRLSGLNITQPTGSDWNDVYSAATQLCRRGTFQRVLQQSYGGVFVDEYQDCSVLQHQLVLTLRDVLPCRVLGDPLQAIFGFRNQVLVDWETDVPGHFERLPDLETPWRWQQSNPALGVWLTAVRSNLFAGASINFEHSPVIWRPNSRQAQWRACMDHTNHATGSVVAIRKWERDCLQLGSTLRGLYSAMEVMDCDELLSHAERIEAATGTDRAASVIAFGKTCLSGLSSCTAGVDQAIRAGRVPRLTSQCRFPDLYAQVIACCLSSEWQTTLGLLDAMRRTSGVHMYRRELWSEMQRAIRLFTRGTHASLKDAAWVGRNITRQRGRRSDPRVLSRTLLIKGLEYDRAIVLDADELTAKELYVALTRAQTTLMVLSSSPQVQPRR
jgi:hypothetical protein